MSQDICKIFVRFLSYKFSFVRFFRFFKARNSFFWHLFGGNIAQHLSGWPFSMASSQVALCDIILREGLLTLLLAHVLHSLDIFQCCVTQVFLSKWFFGTHLCEYILNYTIFCLQISSDVWCNRFFSGTNACGSSLAKQKLL